MKTTCLMMLLAIKSFAYSADDTSEVIKSIEQLGGTTFYQENKASRDIFKVDLNNSKAGDEVLRKLLAAQS